MKRVTSYATVMLLLAFVTLAQTKDGIELQLDRQPKVVRSPDGTILQNYPASSLKIKAYLQPDGSIRFSSFDLPAPTNGGEISSGTLRYEIDYDQKTFKFVEVERFIQHEGVEQ